MRGRQAQPEQVRVGLALETAEEAAPAVREPGREARQRAEYRCQAPRGARDGFPSGRLFGFQVRRDASPGMGSSADPGQVRSGVPSRSKHQRVRHTSRPHQARPAFDWWKIQDRAWGRDGMSGRSSRCSCRSPAGGLPPQLRVRPAEGLRPTARVPSGRKGWPKRCPTHVRLGRGDRPGLCHWPLSPGTLSRSADRRGWPDQGWTKQRGSYVSRLHTNQPSPTPLNRHFITPVQAQLPQLSAATVITAGRPSACRVRRWRLRRHRG